MKNNVNKSTICPACGGHKQLIAWYGNQADDFTLANCPVCNGGTLIAKGKYWVEPQNEDEAPFDEILFDKLPFKVTPEYLEDIKSRYSKEVVDCYLVDMEYYATPCAIEEWLETVSS